MRCIITGCSLQHPYREEVVSGDLFEGSNVYVFNSNTIKGEPAWHGAEEQFYSKAIVLLNDGYFERRGVFVIPKECAVLNAEAKAYIGLEPKP